MTLHHMRGAMSVRAGLALSALALLIVAAGPWASQTAPAVHSASAVAFSPDGRLLAVSDFTANSIALLEPDRRVIVRRAAVASPRGVCWMGSRVYAAQYLRGSVAEIAPDTGKVLRMLPTGAYPDTLKAVPGKRILLVGNTGSHNVAVLDTVTGRVVGRLRCTGEPGGIAVTPDGKRAVVANRGPIGDATSESNAATVAVFDVSSTRKLTEIRLPAGAATVRGAAVTPDGRWACLVHVLGRFNLPTTQLDRGWINTNALSIIDLRSLEHYATVLLDQRYEGAADPWDVVVSPDGQTLWVTLSGVHEVARLNFGRMMTWIAGGLPDDHPLNRTSPEWSLTTRNIWQEIKADHSRRKDLVNDLSALYVGDLIQRTKLPGIGPRCAALSPNGKQLAIAQYFTGDVATADVGRNVFRTALLGVSPPPSPARRGERIFHDGTLAFQHWLSCATCHPDGRSDGLNWDLLNDGIGNPKNTRSLLLAHRRAPMMTHGIRPNVTVATTAGFRYILFRTPQGSEVDDVLAYIRSLQPLPSPYRVGPAYTKLTARALQGKAIFDSKRTRCRSCHSGEYLTDMKLHDTGTRGPYDTGSKFITPPLVEVWRTPPYLHDGRAITMQDVLTRFNRHDKHGVTSHLTKQQVDALSEYLLSL